MTEYKKALNPATVRYGSRNDDVLRSVLHDLYKNRCYWCGKLKDFAGIETDHIIPRTLTGRDLNVALERHGLAHNFDLDDAANLAPICGRCNGPAVKGSHDFTDLPVVASHLRKAQRHKAEVDLRVREFTNRRGLATAFVTLNAADLENAENRRVFKEYMQAIARKLAIAGADLADAVLYKVAEVEVGGGELLETVIELTGVSKQAAEALETLAGVTIQVVVQEPVADLWKQVHRRVRSALEDTRDEDVCGLTNSGPPTAHYFRVDIYAVESSQAGAQFEFTFSGDFESHLSASLVQEIPYGWNPGYLDLQGDAAVQGMFSFTATWDAADDDQPVYVEEATIGRWRQDVWTTESG